MSKVCVLGLGYIGLPTAVMFADSGFDVVGVDINEDIVRTLNNGDIHIEEAGLAELAKKVVENKKLKANTTPEQADFFIIAVPTPNTPEQTANLDYIISASEMILPYVKKGDTVIVESTIPPRTTDDVIKPIFTTAGWDVGNDLYLAHCPERVLPGQILRELVENTRIVGGVNPKSAKKAAEPYRYFVRGQIIETSAVSAELAKLTENTFRDVNIALANELTKISNKLGIDVFEVLQLANLHPRVHLHQPGPGVGGHCLAVDPYFIVEKAPDDSPLISQARAINRSMPSFVVAQVEKLVREDAKIAIFGLTYKGNVDDVRESPALEVVQLLQGKGYELALYDPHVKQAQINYPLQSFEDAIEEADCLLVLADHREFEYMNENELIQKMKTPLIFDAKNCVRVQNEAIAYYNFGNVHAFSQGK